MSTLDLTLGITLVGVLFATMLLGIAIVQTSIFMKTNKQIPYVNKFTVLCLCTLLTIHTMMSSHVVYFYLVTKQGDIGGQPLVWSYTASISLDLVLTNITEILYSLRLWQLLKNNRYCYAVFSPLVVMILLGIAMNIYIPLQVSQVANLPSLGHVTFEAFVILDFGTSSFIDVLLCLALLYALTKTAKRLDWAKTNTIVLISYALNTGALATVVSFCSFIIYVSMPTNLVFLAFRIVLCGFYVNSFLAMLNARFYFQRAEGLVNVALPHGSVIVYENANRMPAAAGTSNNVTINEAGLPIFMPKDEAGQLREIQLMEVKVTKEQTESREE
ncbi:hypothetical protein E4T56_gene3116 [Termitomyces sp. T112]|nr:hypothetical protein E4T56_gene3116 [Termitomyces sp. T112]